LVNAAQKYRRSELTIRNLERVVHPKSLAVVGASDRVGSIGKVVLDNILAAGFEGEIWPVNPKHRGIAGLRCYANPSLLPGAPDLAVIATPPATIPNIVSELSQIGGRAAVVVTAGLTRENGLKQAMLDAARPALFRIIGPNTVGLLIPPLKLNASFAHMNASPGNIALLSQSGAIATALIDWAADNDIGFSHIVSLGDMADVDVGDWLDLLAGEPRTRAIVMYLETIPNPRKFMSAARAAARLKPVIAVKSGRHEAAAKAAATHTGALSGADRVVDAALRRAGILRVDGLAELFDAVETTARFGPVERARVGIVTNGGGAGVLTVDQLLDCRGELAQLSAATIAKLDASLPSTWSHANPVDIIGDAPPERYKAAIDAVATDPGVDLLLVVNCPTALASPTDAARAVAASTVAGRINGKPVLTCWLGERGAREGRRTLNEAGLATLETPADLARAVSYLSNWSQAQRALMRVPSVRSEDVPGDKAAVRGIFRAAASEGRRMLTEREAKAAIAAYGIAVPETLTATTPEEAGRLAGTLLANSKAVVVKLLSKAVSHKSDAGGVIVDVASPEAAEQAATAIARRVHEKLPGVVIEGFAVQPMIVRRQAQELIVGVHHDPIFGPVILVGTGGTAVEVVDDTAIALPPLDDVLAGDVIERTRMGRLLAGFRDRPPADRRAIIATLIGLSQMIVDFPAITAVDINPLLADADGAIALDARIEIDPAKVDEIGPNPALVIRPYPAGWDKDFSSNGLDFHIRPIKPADVALYPDFLARISPDDIRLRFLAPRKSFSANMLKRLTQLDYDRDIAFVALDKDRALAAVGRLSSDPDRAVAEYALIVRTDLQGHGLGWMLLKHIVDYARSERIGRIEGFVLSENDRMLNMCREFGFAVSHHPQQPGLRLVSLTLV
jgi:acetyltransferase